MDKSKSKSFSRKSRKEIEKETNEKFYVENISMQNNGSNFMDYNLPTFLPILPILNYDKIAYPLPETRILARLGDLPLENIESESSLHEEYESIV